LELQTDFAAFAEVEGSEAEEGDEDVADGVLDGVWRHSLTGDGASVLDARDLVRGDGDVDGVVAEMDDHSRCSRA
jgi:hypothetical protein